MGPPLASSIFGDHLTYIFYGNMLAICVYNSVIYWLHIPGTGVGDTT